MSEPSIPPNGRSPGPPDVNGPVLPPTAPEAPANAAEKEGGAWSVVLWVLGGIVALGIAIAAAFYYGLFLLVRWWWTKEPKNAGIPPGPGAVAGERNGTQQLAPADENEPEPTPVTPARRSVLNRIGGALGWLGSQVVEGVAQAGQDDKPNIGGYLGTAKFMPCGVCGMEIPRGAMKCPYCHENPTCGPKIY